MINKNVRPGFCKEIVHNPGTTVTFHPCPFKAKKDGFCAMHHPDAFEKRRIKSQKAWNERQKKDPLRLALAKIRKLQKENKELKDRLVDAIERLR